MPIGALIRRFLVYRLMQYRLAWGICSFLGFYLAITIFLVVSAQQQHTLRGVLQTCTQQDNGTVTFTLAPQPGLRFIAAAAQFTPHLPANLCQQSAITILYETDYYHDPPALDDVSITNIQTGALRNYSQNTRLGFATAHGLQMIFDGTLFGVSSVMLLVAIFWQRVGYLIQWHPNRANNIPPSFIAQVEEDIHWLESLPWGVTWSSDWQMGYERFTQGIALVRGWLGDEALLLDGVELLVRCPAALAYTGAAEVALQCSAIDAAHYMAPGVSFAWRMIQRARALEPNAIETRLTYVHVLAAFSTTNHHEANRLLQQAKDELIVLREQYANHPRLSLAIASVYLAQRRYQPAITALRTALAVAPTLEESNAILDLLAQTLLLAGNLRLALRLFIQLNRHGNKILAQLPTAQRRLARVH